MTIQDLIVQLRQGASSGNAGGIVIAVGALVVLLVVIVAVFYIAYLMSPRGRLEALIASRAERRSSPWVWRILALVLIALAVFGTQATMDRPSACASCHSESGYSRSLAASPHAKNSCMSCHGATGPVAAVSDGLTYGRWTWSWVVDRARPKPGALEARVDPRACLRCHATIESGVLTVRGIRVRHSDILAEGLECAECHSGTTHATSRKPTQPSMNRCLPCHDGKTAPSKCETCHVRDLAQEGAYRSGSDAYRIKDAPKSGNCYTCHSPKPCTSCHGVRMPHPADWGPSGESAAPGQHARSGFAQRESCWRCHHVPGKVFVPEDAACRCHGLLGSMHGGAPWVKEHGLEATGRKPGSASQCFTCHQQALCSYCHPASYAKKYAPVTGADDYKRDMPRTKDDQQVVDGL